MMDFKCIILCHFFTLVGLELIKNDVERVFCDFRKIDFRANFGRILKEKLKKWINSKKFFSATVRLAERSPDATQWLVEQNTTSPALE